MKIAERWQDLEVPDIEGVVTSTGEVFEFRDGFLVVVNGCLDAEHWLNVSVLSTFEIFGGRYVVKCGEASAHGSIGVIVLEDRQLGCPAWVMVSSHSNPFDQVVLKGDFVLVLSTSGAIFRFRPEFEEPFLCL